MGGTTTQPPTAGPSSGGSNNLSQMAQMIAAMMSPKPQQQQAPSPQSSQFTPQAQAQAGGPTFAPDADGNLQIVPAGTLGASAYMNQPNEQNSPSYQKALRIGNAMLGGLPPAPSSATMQQMMQDPQFLNALTQALGGTYGGGSP